MLTTPAGFSEAFEQNAMIRPRHKVTIEWNLNRYAQSVAVTNSAEEELDENLFPLKSVANPVRGESGLRIIKPGDNVLSPSTYNLLADDKAKYKYWVSPTISASSSPYAIGDVNLLLAYDKAYVANKVRVVFEISTAKPTEMTIEITDEHDVVSTVTNPAINSKGVVELFYGGGWNASQPTGQTKIKSIKVNVTKMNVGGKRCEIIEISGRMILDISSRIKDFSVGIDSGEMDITMPVTSITSNSFSMSIDNSDDMFTPDSDLSPYRQYLGGGAEVIPSVGLEGIDGMVPQGVYYTNPWGINSNSLTVSIDCKDMAGRLQEEKMGPVLFINKTVSHIVRALCGIVGFDKVKVNSSQSEYVIPYVFFEDGKTVWENLQSVLVADQGMLTFDETGYLVYTSREDLIKTPANVYALRGQAEGANKANFKSLNQQFSYLVNKVDVNYKRYAAKKSYNQPVDSVLWQAEETISLRADGLTTDMPIAQTFFTISHESATTWPYQGLVNINGEIMSYDGKEYMYKNASNVYETAVVKSAKDKDDLDNKNLGMSFQNRFTGKFVNVVRGLYGTPPMVHNSAWKTYNGQRSTNSTSPATLTTGLNAQKMGSVYRLSGVASSKPGDEAVRFSMWKTGTPTTTYRIYGIRFKFVKGARDQIFGLQFNAPTVGKGGLFFEVRNTMYLNANNRQGTEVMVYARDANGHVTGRRAPDQTTPIVDETWYTMEIVQAEGWKYRAYLNGRVFHTWTEPTHRQGYFGFYLRGRSVVDIEKLYALTPPYHFDIEAQAIIDNLTGSYVSDFIPSETYMRWNKNRWKTKGWEFDDMGSTVHELRKFEVKYDKAPALTSTLYVTNSERVKIAHMSSTPFSAEFILANGWTGTAIANGEDKSILGADNSIDQKVMIYGQLVENLEDNKVSKSNDISILRNGENYLEFDTEWNQTEAQATELMNYIESRWNAPMDAIEVQGYISPAVQVGDHATVSYAAKSMTPETHKYMVTGKNLTRNDSGFSTSTSLVRLPQ